MTRVEGRLGAVVSWLRQGYADGVPPQDYVPLLEVLHRRLSDAEVDALVGTLIEEPQEPFRVEDVVHAMRQRVLQRPGEDDVARVVRRLEAAGWAVEPDGAAPDAVPREDF